MVTIEECVKIGDKYYLKEDVYSIFEPRIPEQFPEEPEEPVEE
jgi:hypothetical protein